MSGAQGNCTPIGETFRRVNGVANSIIADAAQLSTIPAYIRAAAGVDDREVGIYRRMAETVAGVTAPYAGSTSSAQ